MMHGINSKKEEKGEKVVTDRNRDLISFICPSSQPLRSKYLHINFFRQVININNCQLPIGFK